MPGRPAGSGAGGDPGGGADYAAAVGLDKKGTGEQITLVLLEDLGRAVLHRMSKRELLGLLEGCAE